MLRSSSHLTGRMWKKEMQMIRSKGTKTNINARDFSKQIEHEKKIYSPNNWMDTNSLNICHLQLWSSYSHSPVLRSPANKSISRKPREVASIYPFDGYHYFLLILRHFFPEIFMFPANHWNTIEKTFDVTCGNVAFVCIGLLVHSCYSGWPVFITFCLMACECVVLCECSH